MGITGKIHLLPADILGLLVLGVSVVAILVIGIRQDSRVPSQASAPA